MKERRAQFPRPARLMNPPPRKPHPRVVVQIPSLHQLAREVIHHRVPQLAAIRPLQNLPATATQHIRQSRPIPRPQLRPQRQIRLPIPPPINFLHKFFHTRQRIRPQHRLRHLALAHHAMPDRRGQARHRRMPRHHRIPVPRITRHPRQKFRKLTLRRSALRWTNHPKTFRHLDARARRI